MWSHKLQLQNFGRLLHSRLFDVFAEVVEIQGGQILYCKVLLAHVVPPPSCTQFFGVGFLVGHHTILFHWFRVFHSKP
jgi:hypothetical protein